MKRHNLVRKVAHAHNRGIVVNWPCGFSLPQLHKHFNRCAQLKTTTMKNVATGLFLSLTLIVSCSKNDNSASNSVVGTWIFTNQLINSFAYPSVLTNHVPIGSASWSTAFDSVKISFDNNGNYTFSNFHLPVDKGKYIISQDSFIIIKPDTAGFIKFNYSLPSVTFSSGTTPVQISPYSDFHFSTDTILFKKSTNSNIVFSGLWLTKAKNPIIPSNDTLILNQSFNYFKRQ